MTCWPITLSLTIYGLPLQVKASLAPLSARKRQDQYTLCGITCLARSMASTARGDMYVVVWDVLVLPWRHPPKPMEQSFAPIHLLLKSLSTMAVPKVYAWRTVKSYALEPSFQMPTRNVPSCNFVPTPDLKRHSSNASRSSRRTVP